MKNSLPDMPVKGKKEPTRYTCLSWIPMVGPSSMLMTLTVRPYSVQMALMVEPYLELIDIYGQVLFNFFFPIGSDSGGEVS
jgi:hypothetical protein